MNDHEVLDQPIVLDEPDEELEGPLRGSRRHRLRTLTQRARARVDDAGVTTAEYAVGMVMATGFAGVMLTLMKSDVVKGLLTNIVRSALKV